MDVVHSYLVGRVSRYHLPFRFLKLNYILIFGFRECRVGQFMPMEGAQPVIGSIGTEERVEEDRVEVLVDLRPSKLAPDNSQPPDMHRVLAELKKVISTFVLQT